MTAFTGLDLAVLVVYMLGVTIWGAWLGRGQTRASDYFLGSRSLPWWAVMLSVVATETSTLTFLSIPGVSYLGTLTFLQITVGYLLGRIVVAALLLPRYAQGRLTTAYHLLEARFGVGTRRLTSGVFMGTRLLADSVRLFATAIPLALITGWDYPVSILVIGLLTVIYTYMGGIRAVVWVDALQMGLYLLGAVLAGWMLQGAVDGGWGAILSQASAAGKLQVLDLRLDFGVPYTLWGGIFGGAFLSMASHGTDQLIVQRLLTCRDLSSSRKALVGSGVAVIGQFLVFLLLGLGLWVFYQGRPFDRSDEIFARFIVEELPPGLTGLLIAGVFAAAMSSLSSSINALASASAYDFWAPRVGAEEDEERILRAGKGFTLLWSGLLVGGAVAFIPMSEGSTAVEVALSIASLVYGGLLGAFVLGAAGSRADASSVRIGMLVGIATVTLLWIRFPAAVSWPWYVPIGSGITVALGWGLGRGRALPEQAPDVPVP
ncbi:MAG TPA: sodium:solute symporter [Longimicrobiales bacterium]|nr:sodium:solute symporter [Longimicrobiales bacterium]